MATPQQARQAADQHADDLSAYPHVVGIGTRPVRDAPPDRDDGHAVAIYVDRKVPNDQLRPDERLPDSVEVAAAGTTTRVPVVVVEVGAFEPETDAASGADDQFTAE